MSTQGIHIRDSSNPVFTDVVAKGTGGTNNSRGLHIRNNSYPILRGVTSNGFKVLDDTLVVPDSGDALTNGALLPDVDDEVLGLGTPSATRRFVVRLEPGTYDVGTTLFSMQPYVDLEGSGRELTTLTSTRGGSALDVSSATLAGAANAELRSITVENQGGSSNAHAIHISSGANLSLRDVKAVVSGASNQNIAVVILGADPTLNNVTLEATGPSSTYGMYASSFDGTMTRITATAAIVGGSGNSRGIQLHVSSPTMIAINATSLGGSGGGGSAGIYCAVGCDYILMNSIATSSGLANNSGIFNGSPGNPQISNSRLTGSEHALRCVSGPLISGSMLDGGVSCSATPKCIGSWDAARNLLDARCQPIP